MTDLLDMVYEYRLLLSKAERLQIPLDEGETARLMGLARLLEGEAPSKDARRRMPRLPFPSAVQFTIPGGFAIGEVRNVSGGGLSVITRARVDEHARTIVRIARPSEGVEYVFPCRVAWRTIDGLPMVGFEFDGVPSLTSYSAAPRGAWGADLRFGRHPGATMTV